MLKNHQNDEKHIEIWKRGLCGDRQWKRNANFLNKEKLSGMTIFIAIVILKNISFRDLIFKAYIAKNFNII